VDLLDVYKHFNILNYYGIETAKPQEKPKEEPKPNNAFNRAQPKK